MPAGDIEPEADEAADIGAEDQGPESAEHGQADTGPPGAGTQGPGSAA